MPEVAEVAHACALLRRNVVGLTVRRTVFPVDHLLFPALKSEENPTGYIENVKQQVLGATVRSVGRHGKYFWLRLETAVGRPMVMLMHFGMTGRVRMRDVHSHMIFMENGGDKMVLLEKGLQIAALAATETGVEDIAMKDGLAPDPAAAVDDNASPEPPAASKSGEAGVRDAWPPRFTKFELSLSGPGSAPARSVEMAFLDPRRLARVRFLTGDACSTDPKLLQIPPLLALGPDYSKKAAGAVSVAPGDEFSGDPDPGHHGRPRPEFEEFALLVLTRKRPIKALLLDQGFFAGVGNWVSDEILYHARIHPSEVLAKSVGSLQHPSLRRLYDAIVYVMEESVRVEGDARLFPEDWLMLHRWGKGRKEPRAVTGTGHTVDFQTVGGRTSCFIPELQKPLAEEDWPAVKEETEVKRERAVEKEVAKKHTAATHTPQGRSTSRRRVATEAATKTEYSPAPKRKRRARI